MNIECGRALRADNTGVPLSPGLLYLTERRRAFKSESVAAPALARRDTGCIDVQADVLLLEGRAWSNVVLRFRLQI